MNSFHLKSGIKLFGQIWFQAYLEKNSKKFIQRKLFLIKLLQPLPCIQIVFPLSQTCLAVLDWTFSVLLMLILLCRLLASMGTDSINHWIASDLACHKIAFHHCPKHPDKASPNSFIIMNAKSGTRTILHTNLGLPELTLNNFKVEWALKFPLMQRF